jgi:MFS transporter, AAHS family, 4-hydroxybenzoate transporter
MREGTSRVEAGALLDESPWNATHTRIALLAALAIVLDGFDLQVLAYAAPSIMEEWQIDRAALAPLFAAGLVGVGLGAVLLGRLGDAVGRRTALVGSVLLFGASTLAAAWAEGPLSMLILRLLAGLGIGGALPNATAFVSESVPRRFRAFTTTAIIVGVPLGGLLGGALAVELVPRFGWRSLFVVGGVLPIVLAAAIALWLRESPRFLLRAGRDAVEIAAAMRFLLRERAPQRAPN